MHRALAGIAEQPPDWIFTAICRDFETAWDAIARLRPAEGQGRGNFMFARQAMMLLEWACRQCAVDPKGKASRDFGRALYAQRPGYFARVHAPLISTIDRDHRVELPPPPRSDRADRGPLLWFLWDVIRNGQAHQYQQIVARLPDGDVYVALGGPDRGVTIEATRESRLWESDHLTRVRPIRRGELGIAVHPQWLYLDVRAAVESMEMLGRKLPPPMPLTRPDRRSRRAYTGLTVQGLAGELRTKRSRR